VSTCSSAENARGFLQLPYPETSNSRHGFSGQEFEFIAIPGIGVAAGQGFGAKVVEPFTDACNLVIEGEFTQCCGTNE